MLDDVERSIADSGAERSILKSRGSSFFSLQLLTVRSFRVSRAGCCFCVVKVSGIRYCDEEMLDSRKFNSFGLEE